MWSAALTIASVLSGVRAGALGLRVRSHGGTGTSGISCEAAALAIVVASLPLPNTVRLSNDVREVERRLTRTAFGCRTVFVEHRTLFVAMSSRTGARQTGGSHAAKPRFAI